jgi:uncharacterized cupin superfamily protein
VRRTRRSAADGRLLQRDTLDAGLWRSEPATYDYFFATDEVFYLLEGAVTIELPDRGETLELRTDGIGYFKAATHSAWTITERFKKFGAAPAQPVLESAALALEPSS